MWTASEIDDYIQIMSDAHQVLAFSQAHGCYWSIQHYSAGFVNGWSGIYGATLTPFTVPDEYPNERHPWAAGYDTSDGVGYGGSYGFVPDSPQNVITSMDGNFTGDSTGCAERYGGTNSSGDVPVTIALPDNRQYSGVNGYLGLYPVGGEICAGLRIGVFHSTPVLGNQFGAVSWGNTMAPSDNIGYWWSGWGGQTNGPGKLWIVGWAWAETSILASGSGSMTRAQLLQNQLGWLNPGLTLGGGGGGGGGALRRV